MRHKTLFERLLSICLCMALVLTLFAPCIQQTGLAKASTIKEQAAPSETGTVPSGTTVLRNSESAEQESATLGDWDYVITECAVTITKYNGSAQSLTIPASIAGYPVTTIGPSAFINSLTLTQVTIPNSVTTIQKSAFQNCRALEQVYIPNSVTTISHSAFYNCRSLTQVNIPSSVTTLGSEAFSYCTSLSEVSIPNSIKVVSTHAFAYCSSLTEVTIPYGITGIGVNAFYKCTKMTKVVIPNSVTEIGERSFSDCVGLEELTIPDSVISIYAHAFDNCRGLTQVTIGDNVKTIGRFAFFNCCKLTSIVIPNSVITIGEYAFSSCDALTRVIIGSNVTTIGDYAFYECNALVRASIGKSVTTIGYQAFGWCASLPGISVDSNNSSYSSDSFGVLFNADKTQLIQASCAISGSYTIPDSVISISDYAFQCCSNLTGVTFGKNVTSIGSRAFLKCTALTSVTISGSVTNIGEAAFLDCIGLTQVTIGNCVTTIGKQAFHNCTALSQVIIGNNVTSIDSSAFSICKALTEVTFSGDAPSIAQNVFSQVTATVYYPTDNATWTEEVRKDYGGNLTWEAYGNSSADQEVPSYLGYEIIGEAVAITSCDTSATGELVIPQFIEGYPVTVIDGDAFWECTGLTSVTIPDSVTTINDCAFYHCSGLTSVSLGSGVVNIEGGAFEGCSSLTSITIPDSVTEIGEWAFRYCTGLTEAIISGNDATIGEYAFGECAGLINVSIEDGVDAIGLGVFYNCTNLTSISIADGVTSIGNDVFDGCSRLAEITIPGSVVSIGNCAFVNCPNLTNVIFVDGITSIGESTFGGCANLTSITFPDSVTQIGNWAFSDCTGLTEVTFKGNAPSIGDGAFGSVTATVYYPADNDTWTEEVRQDYDGSLTWVACGNESEDPEPSVPDVTEPNEEQSYKLYMDNGTKLYFNGQTESEEVTFRLGATDNADEAVDVYLEEADGGYRLYFMDGESKVYIRIYERIDDAPGYGKGSLELVDYPPEELLSVDSITGTLFYIAPSGKNSYYMGTYGSYSTFSISNTSYITGENAGKVGISQFPAKLEGLSSEFPSQPIPPVPEEAVFEDYTYLLINGQVTITKYTGSAAELEIPSEIEGYPVTAIDLNAFAYHETLTAVTVPDNVTTIGESAFAVCQNLSSVTLGNSVTVIGFGAFQSCSNLTSINIPESVTELLDHAFSNCVSLTDIHLPNNLTVIGYGCFAYCSNLSSISIPESVTYIGDYAFFGCKSMTGIWVDENNPSYCSDSYGVLFSKDQTELLQTPATLSGDYSIPDSVTRISDCAFCWCPELTGIWAGENNLSYSSDSFGVLFDKDKTTLIHAPGTLSGSYSIPDSVTAIGEYAFLGCGNLTAVTIPDSVTKIGIGAFNDCASLTDVVIGNGVTVIGMDAFNNCVSLTNITIPDSVTEIGDWAFYYCTGLKKVVIGDGVTYIGVSAFDHCVSLTGITIPDSVTVIGDWSFTHCTSLTEAIIGNSVSIIGADAFSCCEALTQLTIPDSVTEIAKGAFWSCTGLKEIIIGGCVTTIGDDVFGDCISLTSITIPDSVTEIGNWAFQNCSELTILTIGKSVAYIGEGAFCQCPLTDVYYTGTQDQWDQIDINDNCNEPLLDAAFHYYVPMQLRSQPQAQNLIAGKTAVFTVSVEGTELTYQWQQRTSANGKWTNVTASGSKTSTLSIPANVSRNGYQYRCVITDCFNNVIYSNAAVLKIVTLKITTQPASANLLTGKTAKFTVKASGTSLKYQWQYRSSVRAAWKNASDTGNKTATVSIRATAARNGYQYRCQITDKYGNVIYSNAATLKTVTLKVTGQPGNKFLPAGKTAKFTVKVSGTGLKYQWQYRTSAKGSWKNASGTGNKKATLSVAATAARNGYQYRCKITDQYGNVIYSNVATLKIVTLKITTQPSSVKLAKGKTATFKVVAKGTGLKYQWQFRTNAKSAWKKVTSKGNKTATLKVPVTNAKNGYQYRCVITDKYGNVINSKVATLKVKK